MLGLEPSKPDPGWSLGIAQGLGRIRTNKARKPGPPKEDCTETGKFILPGNILKHLPDPQGTLSVDLLLKVVKFFFCGGKGVP